jgi:predicted TIM-barrel fold metal-dependent hydrolase
MNIRTDTLGHTVKTKQVDPVSGKRTPPAPGTVTKYLTISGDNHMDVVWYPKGIIQDRIAAKYRDAAPKVVESDKGTMWEWEGSLRVPAADGKDWAKHVNRQFTDIEVPEGRMPTTDPEVLLTHMDMGAIYAGVFYGNTRKWSFKHRELELAVYRAFNDWTREVSNASPDRIIVLPWLPARYPDACVAELQRMAKAGARAVEFSPADAETGAPIWSPEWEPLWAAAAEAGVVICGHIGDAAGTPYPPNEYGQSLAHFSQVPFNPIGKRIAEFVFSGMFDRYPDLKVSIAECRIGWLPFLFQWMDRSHRLRIPDSKHALQELPTHYIKKNMTFTFEEDFLGAKMLADPEYGLQEVAIWGLDYPHEQGNTWPDCGPAMERMFGHLEPDLFHELVWGRTQKLFGIKGPQTA